MMKENRQNANRQIVRPTEIQSVKDKTNGQTRDGRRQVMIQ